VGRAGLEEGAYIIRIISEHPRSAVLSVSFRVVSGWRSGEVTVTVAVRLGTAPMKKLLMYVVSYRDEAFE
jgi:hypothetical protein